MNQLKKLFDRLLHVICLIVCIRDSTINVPSKNNNTKKQKQSDDASSETSSNSSNEDCHDCDCLLKYPHLQLEHHLVSSL